MAIDNLLQISICHCIASYLMAMGIANAIHTFNIKLDYI